MNFQFHDYPIVLIYTQILSAGASPCPTRIDINLNPCEAPTIQHSALFILHSPVRVLLCPTASLLPTFAVYFLMSKRTAARSKSYASGGGIMRIF